MANPNNALKRYDRPRKATLRDLKARAKECGGEIYTMKNNRGDCGGR